MTVREFFQSKLVECGLWPKEAEEVLARVEKLDGCCDVQWSSPKEGYPPQLFAVLWMVARTTAVEWIDENIPMHFARMILSEGLPEGAIAIPEGE